jgi:hypothetical protein
MNKEKYFDKQIGLYKAGKLTGKQIKALADQIKSAPELRQYAIHGALAMGKPALAFHLLIQQP